MATLPLGPVDSKTKEKSVKQLGESIIKLMILSGLLACSATPGSGGASGGMGPGAVGGGNQAQPTITDTNTAVEPIPIDDDDSKTGSDNLAIPDPDDDPEEPNHPKGPGDFKLH